MSRLNQVIRGGLELAVLAACTWLLIIWIVPQ